MPLAHCLKGYFFRRFANPVLDAMADQARGADARERAPCLLAA